MNEILSLPAEPNKPSRKRKSRPKRSFPLWTVLIVVLALAITCVAVLVVIIHSTVSHDARTQAELAKIRQKLVDDEIQRAKAARDSELVMARGRQEEVLAQARAATNALGSLLAQVDQVELQATALKTNEAGRLVGLHPDLVAQAQRFYETDLGQLTATADIIGKLENARRVEAQVATNLGTASLPDADLALTVQTSKIWADQEHRRLTQLQAGISSLVSESKIKMTKSKLSSDTPTLEGAIRQLQEAEVAFRQQLFVTNTAAAEKQAIVAKAKAEETRIVTEANIHASNILARAQEAVKDLERQMALRAATNAITNAAVTNLVENLENETRKLELRRRASDPEVQAQLAPFITPGYWTPRGFDTEKKPFSYQALLNQGALDPSPPGLAQLVRLATAVDDKVRPRWKLQGGSVAWYKVPSSLEKVKDAQHLIVELSPVLVEMKLLEP